MSSGSPATLPLRIFPVPGPGAEDVVVGPDGQVYTGTADGFVFALDPTSGTTRTVGETGGRPLGLEILDDERLLVADAHHGLLAMEVASGEVETLVSEIGNVPMAFCNNAAVAADGGIWFSDSSTRYGIEHWKNDFVQHTRTGRLLHRSPSGAVEVVLDGLAFANGVALAADESFVVVAETGARTLVRHWLTGPRAGEREFLAEDLPGYPDNIARGTDGLIWVSIASPRDGLVERLQRSPVPLRKAVTAIPDALQPQPKRTVRAMAFDAAGGLVHDLHGDATSFHMVTGLREHHGTLWLGSLHEPAVACLTVPA